MTRHPRELDRIQRWMQSVITHPLGIAEGMRSSDARTEIDVRPEQVEQIVTRSKSLTSIERLEVYANAYYARLLECLQTEFPALVHAIGAEAFNQFAFDYLQKYPSRSYTLSELGANFPQFLEETRPERDTDDQPDWSDFLIDLARLQRIYSEVFDGSGVEGQPLLKTEELLAISSHRYTDVKLIPDVCLRLESFRFPVHEYATAVREEGTKVVPPAAERTWLAITRRDYIVRRFSLSETQNALLSALRDAAPLGEAIGRAVEATNADVDELALQMREWFRDWTACGFFQRVELLEH